MSPVSVLTALLRRPGGQTGGGAREPVRACACVRVRACAGFLPTAAVAGGVALPCTPWAPPCFWTEAWDLSDSVSRQLATAEVTVARGQRAARGPGCVWLRGEAPRPHPGVLERWALWTLGSEDAGLRREHGQSLPGEGRPGCPGLRVGSEPLQPRRPPAGGQGGSQGLRAGAPLLPRERAGGLRKPPRRCAAETRLPASSTRVRWTEEEQEGRQAGPRRFSASGTEPVPSVRPRRQEQG